ncbi:MAG TPA: sigma-70 family RNA polymerase sigma factor [Rectinemataceae bacterium]|nr:sigma-70 family RNA polymerase sigma factor [Rectinemataceae bacterium]
MKAMTGFKDDEELIHEVAEGGAEALTQLYRRYAALVFHLAFQSLGRESAEDLVQDSFLAVWSKAGTFDPKRGSFRAWLLQITHFRIINELRRRSRRPKLDPDSEDLDSFPDGGDEPALAAWRGFQKEAIRAAVERLPPAQGRALSLAFFEDLSHDQVAEALRLPLGTVKTRIRSAVRRLRSILAAVAAVAILAGLAGLGLGFRGQLVAASRAARALAFVTASDITTIHLSAGPGLPSATHGSYRGRAGTDMAVMALHNLPEAPKGMAYQAWVRSDGAWMSLGLARPDAAGNAMIVAETSGIGRLPLEVQVTLEPGRGSPSPSGAVTVFWKGE